MRRIIGCLLILGCRQGGADDADKTPGDPDAIDTLTDSDPPAESDPPTDTDPAAESDPPVDSDLPVDSDPPGDTAPDTDAPDADADAVPDRADRCPGLDDRVDLDADGVPDCAETLVPNAQIAASTAPWHLMPTPSNVATVAYSAADASGWAGSGSLAVENQSATVVANAAGVFSGCVAAHGVDTFDILYHYRVPSTTAAGTNLQLITSFDAWSDAACQVPWGSITPGPPALVFDRWAVLSIHALQIPPAVHGVMVRVELFKPGTSAPVPFGLDDVLLQPTL